MVQVQYATSEVTLQLDEYLYSRHEDVDFADFWLGVEMLTRQMMVYVWTRKGEMKLSVRCNKEFCTRAFFENLLCEVKHILLGGLSRRHKSPRDGER